MDEAGKASVILCAPKQREAKLRRLGDYELLEEIARGGMGVVFKARQISLDRVVAVKMILSGEFASEADVQRFRQEALAAAQLQHPNIVALHEVGEQDGMAFFSMDYVEGCSLAEMVRRQPLSPQRATGYLQTIAQAIQYAHEQGILHRDLKPANVLIDEFDQPRITDFGLAKRFVVPPSGGTNSPEPAKAGTTNHLTLSGRMLGSPNFMPPEQVRGRRDEVGPHSDVYSLGALLYHLLTGRPPFAAATFEETLLQVLDREPARPRALNPALPRDLETICLKCLEKDPRRRYGQARELAEELGRFRRGEPLQARPLGVGAKAWRWCRHRPAMAGLFVALLIVAIGGPVMAWRNAGTRADVRRASEAARQAQRRAEETHLRMAELSFARQNAADGLAYLALLARRNPADTRAAERLISALTYRQFALPACPPVRLEAEVTSGAVFSPNGRRFVTGCRNSIAQVWDASTGQPLTPPLRHESYVTSARFSPDGQALVTTAADGTARVWHAGTGRLRAGPLRHTGEVWHAEFSPDNSRVLTASWVGTARIWDAHTGQPVFGPLRHDGEVNRARFSPDGQRLVTASGDRTARLWDARTGQPIGEPVRHKQDVRDAQFSPDGQWVATASHDGTVLLWNGRTAAGPAREFRHPVKLDFLRFSPDGQRLAAVSLSGRQVLVSDVATGLPLFPALQHLGAVHSADFNSTGTLLVTSCEDRSARLWDATKGVPWGEPLWHEGPVQSAQFSPDGQRVLTASQDQTARVWDVRPGEAPAASFLHERRVAQARFSPDGHWVLTVSHEGTAQVWDARTASAASPPLRHDGPVVAGDFSPDGRKVLTASEDGTARIWDSFTGAPVAGPFRHADRLTVARFSPDGDRVVTGSADRTARLWDARRGQALVESWQHDEIVTDARFSPDGWRVVTASRAGSVRIWDARTGRAISAPIKHEAGVHAARFSPDGARLVTASSDRTARIWDAFTGQPLSELLRHAHEVQAACFSPDGTKVATASLDHTACLWDARTGQPLLVLRRDGARLLDVQFSPDGERLVTASREGVAQVWDARDGRELSEPLRHEADVLAATFSPDGQRVLTASKDATARLWETPKLPVPTPAWLPALAEAVAGLRLDDRGLATFVPPEELLKLKGQFAPSARLPAENDVYTRWATWFFADRSTRTTSFAAELTVADFLQRQARIQRDDAVGPRGARTE